MLPISEIDKKVNECWDLSCEDDEYDDGQSIFGFTERFTLLE